MYRATLAALAVLGGGCGGDDSEPPLYPADYAATYQEVRGCRRSIEHDLMTIRVLASPDAVAAYTGRTAPFPTGSILLKEEFDSGDVDCSGPIINVTVMQKLAVGSAPATLDWTWQKIDADARVMDVDIERCTRCHTACGIAPDGYDGTCTVP
ncbi:MAG: cytochrome P460 family protein [Deltaproteobacteria bacterium]|nr:cytochrome P460 family protein [Deltaproteobacteria bacterium]